MKLMTGPLSRLGKLASTTSTGLRLALLFALICNLQLAIFAIRYLRYVSWNIDISFQGTSGNSAKFVVHNRERSDQFVRIDRFILTTPSFAKLDWDVFERWTTDQGRFVPPGASVDFSVEAAANTDGFLCSSLRADGLFASYGTLIKGKLSANGTPASLRVKQIVEELTCAYGVVDFAQDAESKTRQRETNEKQRIRVPCSQVNWIQACIAQIMPPDG